VTSGDILENTIYTIYTFAPIVILSVLEAGGAVE